LVWEEEELKSDGDGTVWIIPAPFPLVLSLSVIGEYGAGSLGTIFCLFPPLLCDVGSDLSGGIQRRSSGFLFFLIYVSSSRLYSLRLHVNKNGLGQVDKPDTAAVQVEINCSEKQVTARSRIRSTHTPSIRCFIPSKPYRTLALERLFPPSTSSRPLRIPSVHHSHHHNIIIDASSKPPRITPKPSVCVILGETDPSPRRLKTPSLTNNLMLDILDPRNSRELQPTERGDFFDLQSNHNQRSAPEKQMKKNLMPFPTRINANQSQSRKPGTTRKLTHCCTVSTSSKDTPIRLVPLKCPPRLPRQILHHDPAEDDAALCRRRRGCCGRRGRGRR
jgi:hypothetical protein